MKNAVIKILPAVIILTAIFFAANAQTNVNGYILSNTTWTLANSPYIVTGNILVNNGVTLTIEPGVTVMFDTTRSLQIDGELIAIGTAQNRIMFTATDTTPAKGSWGRIQFSPTSLDAVFDTAGNYVSGSIMKYCDIQYGGGVPGDVTVYCDTAAPYFSHCRVSECLKHAIYFVNAVGKVDSSVIRNCGGTAITYDNHVAAAFIAKSDTLENNGGGIIKSGLGFFTSITIHDCIFTNSGNAISNLISYTYTDIKNNVFTSNLTAVYLSSTDSSIISNNEFTSNANAIQGALGVNATISGNTFIGHTQSVIGTPDCYSYSSSSGGPPSYHNSSTLGARNLTISGNHFENNMGAIYVGGSHWSDPVLVNYAIIQSNTFLNSQFMLTNEICSTSGNCYYYNNCNYRYIRIWNGIGILMNNIFDGNTTSSTLRNLVKIEGQWEVANNIFKNNSPGDISFTGNATICSNKFHGNSGAVMSSASGSAASPFIHDNEFLNNSGGGALISISNNSAINNNEFQGNSCSGSTIISLTGAGISTVSNNRFLSNLNSGCPIITSGNNTNIHHNDFLDNTGLSCIRINARPVIANNNFINPNIQYEVENQIPFGPGSNISIPDNYWGTTNTAHIDSVIKDFFDDANLSVALYPPVLAAPAFVDTNASCTSVVCSLSVSGTVVNASCFGGNNGSINITVSNGTSPYTYVWSSGASTEDISSCTSGSYTVTVIDANFCSATKSFTISQPSSVSVVSGVVTNANCNTGGSINIATTGGTSPYTYNWGSGIITQNRTSLNPGNYMVTVKDNNNCTTTQSFTVGQDSGPVISGVVSNTNCHNSCDGAINLSVIGTPPFTYDWGTGFGTTEDTSGLCARDYSVTVADSNNCGIAASFTITSPPALTATASITTAVSCFGYSDGMVTSAATGGTPPYTFLWSTGQATPFPSGFAAGTYDVTVTDSQGCTAVASVTVPDGHNVFVGAIGGPSTGEVNQSSSYIISANFNYSYTWSVVNGIIISGLGTNTIEITWTSAGTGFIQLIASEQGCVDTVSKSVTVIDTAQNCSAQFYLYPDTIPHSYFVVNTASGISQLSYSWDWSDGTTDTGPYPSHTYSAQGFYTICLTITDSAGCTDTYCNPYYLLKTEDEASAMIQVNVISPAYTGIRDALLENVVLYPNPTNGTITLKAAGIQGQSTLKLFDALGRKVWQQSSSGNELTQGVMIDLSQMNEGVFFLNIRFKNGSRIIKVVKY